MHFLHHYVVGLLIRQRKCVNRYTKRVDASTPPHLSMSDNNNNRQAFFFFFLQITKPDNYERENSDGCNQMEATTKMAAYIFLIMNLKN